MLNTEAISSIFPETVKINGQNHLAIGGCDTVELAGQYGTPLYLFDEDTLRNQCRRFVSEFTKRYKDTRVIYACKAFLNRPLARLFREEGLGLDVVSGGELSIAQAIGFPTDRVYFHGNNKTPDELRMALDMGVGRIVVDNLHELAILNQIGAERGVRVDILLRVSPGIDPHTHQKTTTGIVDSKFGLPISTGQAEEAVAMARAKGFLNPIGLHFHLGSPIFELEPYRAALAVTMDFAASMASRYGFSLEEMSPGGGFAVQYVTSQPSPPVADYAQAITSTFAKESEALGITPKLIIEPGRAIVARAGVALYTVGAIKEIPGVRKYVSVDGGMADNIRPTLYGAKYEAVVAGRVKAEAAERVTIAGKFCESGDVLIPDIEMPPLQAGDLVAIPTSGAYCLSMASNYNASLRPPIVLVKDGSARLIRRRETYEDLMRYDVME